MDVVVEAVRGHRKHPYDLARQNFSIAKRNRRAFDVATELQNCVVR
jgi:hypothetical protein